MVGGLSRVVLSAAEILEIGRNMVQLLWRRHSRHCENNKRKLQVMGACYYNNNFATRLSIPKMHHLLLLSCFWGQREMNVLAGSFSTNHCHCRTHSFVYPALDSKSRLEPGADALLGCNQRRECILVP
jgi:hypothetical protein